MNANNNSEPLEYRDFVITRVFNAPRDLVWKVWTEPEHLSQWLSPMAHLCRSPKWSFAWAGSSTTA